MEISIFSNGYARQKGLCNTFHLYIMILFILSFISLMKSSQDLLKPAQAKLESVLLSMAKGTEPFPLPGRPMRHLVARCFIALYSRGETRSLFDTLLALIKVASETKQTLKDRDARV